MIAPETQDIGDILLRVETWPTEKKLTLARRLMQDIEAAATAQRPRGYSAEEVVALLRMPQPAPDDETVKRWIDEHRVEKYG